MRRRRREQIKAHKRIHITSCEQEMQLEEHPRTKLGQQMNNTKATNQPTNRRAASKKVLSSDNNNEFYFKSSTAAAAAAYFMREK